MGLWVRRVLALGAMLAALAVLPAAVAAADTASPTAPASSTPVGSPSPSATTTVQPEEQADLPDVPLDDSRTVLALAGAGVLAVAAAAVVFLRR